MEFPLPCRFETHRLLLREPHPADAQVLFASYTQDVDVARYMVWRPHADIAETDAFIQDCIAAWQGGVRRPYVIERRGHPGEAVGMLEARWVRHTVDIGYVLARPHWGMGLMPEAVAALAETALDDPRVFRVQGVCDVDNPASARTFEKSGFSREGRLERHMVHPNIGAEPRACFLYARCR